MNLLGYFRIEEIRDNANVTDLKEGEGIEMSTTVHSIYAMHALLRLCIYLPVNNIRSRKPPPTKCELAFG